MITRYEGRFHEIVFDEDAGHYRVIGPAPVSGPRDLLAAIFGSYRAARSYIEGEDARLAERPAEHSAVAVKPIQSGPIDANAAPIKNGEDE